MHKLVKYFIIVSLVIFSLSLSKHSVSQTNSDQLINETVSAFKTNNTSKISSKFNSTVDILIGDTDDSFSKKQASVIFSGFMRTNKCSDFNIKQKGSVNNNSSFIIAEYLSGAKKYRVYMLFKKKGSIYLIYMVEFEEI